MAALFLLPLVPHQPLEGLDPSWAMALHVAYLRGMDFGTDVVFTFGPLGFAFTRLYWPGTFPIVVLFWGVLAAGLLDAWFGLARRMGREAWLAWPAMALTSAFAAMFAYDVPPIAYMLLLVMRVEMDPPGPARLAAHGAALGVIALVKLTLTIAGGLAVASMALLLWLKGRRRDAAVPALAALVAFLACWLALSQPLANLPRYFHGAWVIASGYADAMGKPGPAWEVFAYASLSAGMAVTALALVSERRDAAMGASFAFAGALLLIVGTHAFTRHDAHAYLAFAFLVYVSLALAARSSPAGRAITVASMAWIIASAGLLGYVLQTRVEGKRAFVQIVLERPGQSLRALAGALSGKAPWQAEHEHGLAQLRAVEPLPPLPGKVDVYSFNQSAAFAHGLDWHPRPVMQSYAAYTAELADANRRHLLGAAAPDHLLVRIQPIEGRLPANEDGASWLSMLERYALRTEEGFVVLDRQPVAQPAALEPLPPWHGTGWRELPDEPALLAALTIHEPGGGLAGVFKRKTALRIQLRTEGGEVHEFRFLRSVGAAPFLLSPLVRSNADFASLFIPCSDGVGAPRVAAARILDARGEEVPFTLKVQAVRNLPRFEASRASEVRVLACRLRLVAAIDAVRAQFIVADGGARGINAHPPAIYGFARPASRIRVCTRLVAEALGPGRSDGYWLSLKRRGAAAPVAQLHVPPQMLANGEEACVEAHFAEPVADAELHVGAAGDGYWDWVYITRVDLDG